MCALIYVHDVIETSFGLSLKEILSDASSPAMIGTISRLEPEDYVLYSPKELGEEAGQDGRETYIRKGSVPDIFEMAITHFNRALIEGAAKQGLHDLTGAEAVDIDVSGYRLRRKHTDVDYRNVWINEGKASYPVPAQLNPPQAGKPDEILVAEGVSEPEEEPSLRWPHEDYETPPPRSFEEYLARM